MILGAFERTLAWRYLRARRQEGFVSVIAIFSLIGIALGVAALIVTMSVMNGFASDLLGRILGFGGHITVSAAAGNLGDYDALQRKIASVPGVVAVRPVIEGQALASANGRSTGVMIRGIHAAGLHQNQSRALHLMPGAADGFAQGQVILGVGLAESLGVSPGDIITLTLPNMQGTTFVPRTQSFTVGGLFDVDIPDYDDSFLFMPLAVAQDYFDISGAVTGLEVFIADANRVPAYEPAIAQAAGQGVRLVDWQQSNAALFGAIEVERSVMFVVLSLIILVAAFNIICSMTMLVKDKGHDIAILRTMGATSGMILRIFMLSGASIGVVGTVAGFGLGIYIASHIQEIQHWIEAVAGDGAIASSLGFFATVPARIDLGEVIAVLAMALALSLLATLYPSWRAARLDPVEALRYE